MICIIIDFYPALESCMHEFTGAGIEKDARVWNRLRDRGI